MAVFKIHIVAQLFFVFYFSLSCACDAWGQSIVENTLNDELMVTSSNDNYMPPFEDCYFTNGLKVKFSRATKSHLLRRNAKSGRPLKSIVRVGIAHEIYTPKNTTERDPHSYNRPYAGYLYSNFTVDTFWEGQKSLRLAINAGIIGPLAGGGRVQAGWHKLIKQEQPVGWENQIGNVIVINFRITYRRAWTLSQRFDVISAAGAEMGTGFNNLYSGVTVRTGEIRTIDRSAVTGSILDADSDSVFHEKEWYLLFGVKSSFVVHNALIEGNLFQPSTSRYTNAADLYLLDIRAGFAYSINVFTWKVTMHRLSPEVAGGGSHTYASLEMAMRF